MASQILATLSGVQAARRLVLISVSPRTMITVAYTSISRIGL